MAAETIEVPIERELTSVPLEPVLVEVRVRDPYWYDGATCSRLVAEDLSPEKRKGGGALKLNDDERYVVATFCGKCTVREDCLADAIRTEDRVNIRGGLLAGQRNKLQASFKEQHGFVDEREWQAATQVAAQVRSQFLQDLQNPPMPKRRLEPRSESTRIQKSLVEFLRDQPDGSLVTERGQMYLSLAEQLNTRPDKVRMIVNRMVDHGFIQKIADPTDRRFTTSLKLVS